MKSYDQYCALAKALDVVGDRWTLLVVRELLLRGPARYTDIAAGLPGIATNLLADRLNALEEAGLVVRRSAAPPIATTLFELTERGAALEAAMHALGTWGAPLLAQASGREAFCPHWLALPTRSTLRDHYPSRAPVAVEVRAGDEAATISTEAGRIHVLPGAAPHPDVVVTAKPPVLLRLLIGRLSLSQARSQGLKLKGNVDALKRILPRTRSSRRMEMQQ